VLALRPYQIIGRDFLASRRHALLADEMRVGKTPQAILAAGAVHADKILVVCPAIAIPHWKREFDRWWPLDYMTPHVVIRSYDRAKTEADSLLRERWSVTIVDECHFAKNPEAQRTKLVYGKGGLGWVSKRLWALSGTPAPKHAGELWAMLRAFGATGMDYQEFCWRYCQHDWTGRIVGTNVARIPELKEALAKVMLRRKRKDVAPDMPDIGFEFLEVDPVSHADLPDNSDLSDDDLLHKLESNPTADREDRVAVAKAKALPLVEEITFAIENDLLAQTVVFGWHVEPLQDVAQGLAARGITVGLITGATSATQREHIQQDFREGRTQVVVANVLAAGTAIDLSAARHGYFLELDWVPGNNLQAANRLVNMDKDDKVTFDIATWPGSADDRVQKILLRRAQELSKLL
jgi:SWI/SNF-related matrix-associated actin-dependent regulator 1 of chromatin subfamily A